MDIKKLLKSNAAYIVAILLFFTFSAIYYAPSYKGKVIQSSDISSFQSTSSEIKEYREIETKKDKPEQILWTNSAFSGMPTYMISHPNWMNKTPQLKSFVSKITRLAHPYFYLALGLIGVFFLLVTFGVNPWLSIIGSFTYNLASYHFILIAHGHNSKAIVIAHFAYVLIGLALVFRHKKYFWGTLLFAFALVWQITAAHIQMTYYLIFISAGYVIAESVVLIKDKSYKELLKITGLLAIAVVIALSTNTGKLWTEYEYANHTMRGGREIASQNTNNAQTDKAGLSNQYILSYSYDLGEAFSGIMPQAKGLYKQLPEKSSLYKALEKSGNGKIAKNFNKEGRYYYWGHQTASAAPFYYGAVMFALFVLALFVVKGHIKYWLASVALLTFMLTIGKNTSGDYSGFFYGIQDFFIKHFPLYDKFRDVKNIVTVQSLAMVILAFIGLSHVFSGKISTPELKKALRNTLIVLAGLFLIIAAAPTILGNTDSARDAYMFKGWPDTLIKAMRETRIEAIRADAIRALLFGLAAMVIVWLTMVNKKLKFGYAMVALMAIIAIDMLPQDLKVLNHDTFVSRKKNDNFVTQSKADQVILKDKDPNYRVFKFGDSFNDAFTSKYHKSIGGYSAAKLSRYQDLIEYSFAPFIQQISQCKTNEERIKALFSCQAMNMLNTKYFILNPDGAPLQNPNAYGNAWMANQYQVCDGALDEITQLNKIQHKQQIVLDKKYAGALNGKSFDIDTTASIKLSSYHPNHMSYAFNATKEQLVVFSEIYYAPNGWQAYIDGKKAEHFRANYILRAMVVPAGQHQIEFKFEPRSYFVGTKISQASSYLLILLLLGGLAFEIIKYLKKQKKTTTIEE